MKHSRQLKKNRDNNPFLLLPISRRKAKGKSGNSGILPRNGQIQLVSMETIFSRPNWTKYQH